MLSVSRETLLIKGKNNRPKLLYGGLLLPYYQTHHYFALAYQLINSVKLLSFRLIFLLTVLNTIGEIIIN